MQVEQFRAVGEEHTSRRMLPHFLGKEHGVAHVGGQNADVVIVFSRQRR